MFNILIVYAIAHVQLAVAQRLIASPRPRRLQLVLNSNYLIFFYLSLCLLFAATCNYEHITIQSCSGKFSFLRFPKNFKREHR